MAQGPQALSETELLAVILRTGTKEKSALELAADVLVKTGFTPNPGLPGLLHMSVAELMKIPGIGKVKAVQLKCIGELSRRLASAKARMHLKLADAASIADYYMEKLRHEEQEVTLMIALDSKNQLLGEQMISRGTFDSTLISPREILREALRLQAMQIVLVHNHPSGDPNPSLDDLAATRMLKEACETAGIIFQDHIIIGDHRYFSFREKNYDR